MGLGCDECKCFGWLEDAFFELRVIGFQHGLHRDIDWYILRNVKLVIRAFLGELMIRNLNAAFRVAALLVCATLMPAQSNLNQQISGTVTDASGAALPNAVVTVANRDTGLTRVSKSNTSGYYVVPELPTGKYLVTGELAGFSKARIDNNPLNANVSIEVNLKLQIGAVTDTVTVQANAVVLDTTSGELGFTVTGEEASELQLNGRNFPELLAMLPGVSTTYTDGFGLFGGFGVNNSGQSINGGRTDTTTWNLDGADNKDNGGGGNNFININPDAIGEMRVLTSNYSAETGSSSGAVVNMAIRSGTKKFHGKLYEYWRNDRLQASSFNSAGVGKPKLRWNNFGGNIGGPISIPKLGLNRSRDKLFFFYSEDIKYLRTGATTTWNVPTAAQKDGNFGTVAIRDPLTQIPFPSNILPPSLINSNMRKLINIYPLGNQGNTTFSFNVTTPTQVHQEVLKLDFNHNEKNQISFHYVHDQYRLLNNTTNLVQNYRAIPGINTSLQWTHVFTPTLINVLQFSFSGNVIIQQTEQLPNSIFIKSFTREGLGITLPTIYNASNVIPQVAITNLTTLTVTPLVFNNYNRIFSLKEGLTKIVGNHNVKMGALFMRSRKNQDNPPAINGQFTFTNGRQPSSGQALADALLGNFQSYTESPSVREGWYRFTQIEPYIQDDWKVRRRLTVNVGLRWSYMQPQYSALNNTVQFLPQYYDRSKAAVISPVNGTVTSAPDPYNGLVIPGNGFPDAAKGRIAQYSDPAVKSLFHDLPLGGAYTRWGNFAPRLGFAYDLTGKQATVLRGGFGVAYERIQGNFIFSGINNTPFNPSTSVISGNVENPSNGAAGAVSPVNIVNSHYLDMKNPRTLTWSLGVQQRLGTNMSLSVSYVGSSAANLSYIQNINQLPVGVGKKSFVPGSTTVLANTNSVRPYPGYGNIQQYMTGANFIYNSMQTQFRKQFKKAGSFNTSFTWSKGRTDANAFNYQPRSSYNLRDDWGATSYNRKFILSPSWVYPIPFWRGGGTWYKQALGGWQINGVGQFQTGLPVNPVISADQAGTGAAAGQRPNLVGDPYSGGTIGGFQILNKSAFGVPALGTLGNLGAYNIYLPNWINLNASLVKSFFTGGEKLRWDLRFEGYNVANHLVTSAINVSGYTGPTQTNWGQKTGTTPPRAMQFSVRINF